MKNNYDAVIKAQNVDDLKASQNNWKLQTLFQARISSEIFKARLFHATVDSIKPKYILNESKEPSSDALVLKFWA